MIGNFHRVNDLLYRSAAPSVSDLLPLKDFGIRKIVSLDEKVGKKIDRGAKIVGIKHVMIPIELDRRGSLLRFLCQDLFDLLQEDGPILVHCMHGKDRTSLAVGMFRCRYQDWPCDKAIAEAHKYGFGIGLGPEISKLYIKLIRNSCKQHDHKMEKDEKNDVNNAYDITSNQREYPSAYNDYSLDAWEQQSWSPYSDYRVREFPYANVDTDWEDQYDTRITYGLDDSDIDKHREHNRTIPMVGQWDNATQGLNGSGPSLVSGYI